ncbi:hypothetical protein B0T24DRAFT_199405 [Lasiosphaeria ovina]|uniref:Azaphilone pigments biosynthesis cluster protein L N-terminal domain-containing protein n=1 Tax=Lasiosphaeria ovina TaxID=92902 RepID=A0AAE0NFW8_9PEZI|nr:hypothetical protein B0T24DRAFT_199405 [Lasiosphaeria ovina]
MDPLSISTACLALLGGIGKTTFAVTDFVRGYRAARSDLTALTGELTQLQLVLELIKDDTAVSDDKIIPTSLQSQVLAIIKNCFSVMEKVDTVLENHKGTSGPVKWVVSGKTEVNGLLMSLEAHRASLSLVVDLVSLAVSKAVKQDTSAIRAQVTDIKQDTSLIPELMDEVMRLRAIIGGGDIPSTSRGQNFVLQQYLDGLTSYAETVCNDIECDLPNESRSGESRTLSHEDLISFSEPSIAGPTQGDPIHLQVRASPSAARGEWTSPGESPTPSLPAAPSSEPTSPAITVENPLRSEVVYVDCGPSLSPKQPPPAGQKSEDSSSDVAITRARKNERTTTLRDIFHVLKRISAPVIPKNVVLLNACGYGSCGISSLIV